MFLNSDKILFIYTYSQHKRSLALFGLTDGELYISVLLY